MAQKVIVPQKKNYVPQFLKQRDINSYLKTRQKKVIKKTSLTNMSKSRKSAYFRHVFDNNFFWYILLTLFQRIWNHREILGF